MNERHTTEVAQPVYYRLITLWVACEAFAGGIFHAIKVPGSGLIVGSCSVICISLIYFYTRSKSAIFKAAIVVAIFKMMLSPHSPITAYVAVFFQALMGQLIFSMRINFRLACILLAVIALVESAIQRILILTLVYGSELWTAVDEFIRKIAGSDNDYAIMIAAGYIILHAVAGVAIGNFVSTVPGKVAGWRNNHPEYVMRFQDQNITSTTSVRKKRRKFLFLIIWFALLVIYLQSLVFPASAWLPPQLVWQILTRAFLMILGWYLLLGPVLSYFFKRWLEKKKGSAKEEMSAVTRLLPSTRLIISEAWNLSRGAKGYKRIKLWGKIVLQNVLD
jgi:hypothetical protein